jgi:hypothetical protein
MTKEFAWHVYPQEKPKKPGQYWTILKYGVRGNTVKTKQISYYSVVTESWTDTDNKIVCAWMEFPREPPED